MNKKIKSAATLITLMAVFSNIAIAQNADLQNSRPANLESRQSIASQMAVIQDQIDKIQRNLENERFKETASRTLNSAALAGEVATLSKLLIDLISKNYRSATSRIPLLAGAIVGHISFLKLSASRTDGVDEQKLIDQKKNLENLLLNLQVELSKLPK